MHRLSRIQAPIGAPALFLCEVPLIVGCFLIVTLLILNVDPVVFLLADNGILRIGLAVASILFGLYFEDLYSRIMVKSRVLLIQQLSMVMGIALLIQGFIGYVNDGWRLPVRVMLPVVCVLIALLFGWRIAYSAFVLRVVGAQRILFVGMCPMIEEIARHIEAHPELGLEAAGYLDGGGNAPRGMGKFLGPLSALQSVATSIAPDLIVAGFADPREHLPIAGLLQLRYAGMPIEQASVAYEQLFGRVLLSQLHPSEVLLSPAFHPRRPRLLYQTAAHWIFALIAAILTLPLLLLAAAMLGLSSRAPLFEQQLCTGLDGKPFRLFRLRLDYPPGKPNRVQSFVARWRLAALPELWNVLRGEMCLVGPRADPFARAAALGSRIPFYRQRNCVKPGITGWAEINASPDHPDAALRRLEFDFYYLKNFSSGLDAYILVRTLRDLLLSPPQDVQQVDKLGRPTRYCP